MAKATKDKNKVGRPSSYTDELAEDICIKIATSSKSMKTICDELNISVATVLNWLTPGNARYIEKFEKKYARAKEMQADWLADELLSIADDGSNDTYTDSEGVGKTNFDHIQRSRLRVDARKWVASKLKPKKYSDKLDVTSMGEKITPIVWKEVKSYDTDKEAD